MISLVTIASFEKQHQAHIAKAVLKENGIDARLKGELINQTFSFISNPLGGFQLIVDHADVQEAHLILLEAELIEKSNLTNDETILSDAQLREHKPNFFTRIFNSLPIVKNLRYEYQILLFVLFSSILFFAVLLWIGNKGEDFSERKNADPRYIYYTEQLPIITRLMDEDPTKALDYLNNLEEDSWMKKNIVLHKISAYEYLDSFQRAIDLRYELIEIQGVTLDDDLHALAIYHHLLGNVKESEKIALELTHRDSSHYSLLADLKLENGNDSHALVYYLKALEYLKDKNENIVHPDYLMFLRLRIDSLNSVLNK